MDDRLNSLLDLVRASQAKQREIMLEIVSVLREIEKSISSLNTYIDDTIEDKIERMLLDAQHLCNYLNKLNSFHFLDARKMASKNDSYASALWVDSPLYVSYFLIYYW